MSFRNFILPGLILALISACAPPEKPKDPGAGDPAQGLPEEGGFFPPDHESVPEPVRQASESVFMVLIPSERQTVEVDTSLGAGLAMRTFLQLNEKDPVMRTVMIRQYQYCEDQQGFFNRENKKCRVSLAFNRGTGFLLNDGKSLWTASHVLENAFAPKDLAPIFVFDRKFNSLYDPFQDPPSVTKGSAFSEDAAKDYAKLSFTKELGKPLALARAHPIGREEVFAIGFPSCSNCQMQYPEMYVDRSARKTGPDAPGNDQRISRGRPYHRWRTPLLDTTVDVLPGNSGGPGVDREGRVFGVAVLTGTMTYRRESHRQGTFVIPPEWRR